MPLAVPQHDLARLGSKKVSYIQQFHFFQTTDGFDVRLGSYIRRMSELDWVRCLYARSTSMHDLALMVDLLCPRFNGDHKPSLPSVTPFLQSFSTELLPSVPVIVLTSLLVRLQPFLCSKSFASSMVNCLTETCAWSSYLSLIHYPQCWMPLAEPQHDLARLS